ncbi:hypothetical protein CcrC1_gp427 [Caulobacter phage C1]|nr:hypothetical protein CcrC1_gp427 [Caulobacter phage C1]UTU08656.1 hypothetical protein CcrC2_gp428 [Caulobacter phage C2]UTU09169.1 hypothetical protein CcrJ4_gp422 [Caulobacter phage J4]UTU10288.1 hypothetical protein CcrRB23_gp426 [Caulobacter phage RB23]WGN97322.1 hypothetical protein [Bertelyvirus sp.]
MPDHRFIVLTPLVKKVREKSDLKSVRKADWFRVFEGIERLKDAETIDYEAAGLAIKALLLHLPVSDVGGKQLRADAYRRLVYLESVL